MFPYMNRSKSMTHSVRRPGRRAGQAIRRGAPAVVTVLILLALVGSTLAGALAF